ncbi:hypothetical protein V5799_027533 [Amblyomma americanum]|uniref:Uncharacterized protein n=1 Tax=Amblyomma americanum TaxID=6943 RepID=A0AAQ4DFF9_AMBAM
MLPTAPTPSVREGFLAILVFGFALHLYNEDIHRIPLKLGRSLVHRLVSRDGNCTANQVIKTCNKEDLVKVLFVVDTVLGNRSNRRFARNSYAKRSFASPIHWLTVFNLVGNVTNEKGELAAEALSECRSFGDIVVLRKNGTGELLQPGKEQDTSSYLQFVPWILENCPHVDLVVFMQDSMIPHPYYLPNYRVRYMDHRPEAIHCHSLGGSTPPSFCHWWSVLMAKRPGLTPLLRDAFVQDSQINLNGLEGRDLTSYVSVDDSITMIYTIGAVLFYALPPNLTVSMLSLWKEMLRAPENNANYLRL